MTRLWSERLSAVIAGALLVAGSSCCGQAPEDPRTLPGEPSGRVAWGKPVEGLQAGIRLVSGVKTWRVGEIVRFALVVRNITDHPIDVAYYPVQDRFGWTATTMNGAEVLIAPVEPTREFREMPLGPAIELTLEQGKETLVPGKGPEFVVAEPGNSIVTQPTIFVSAGRRVTVQARPLNVVAKGEEWLGRLLTGKLSVAVMRAGTGSGRDRASKRPQRGAAPSSASGKPVVDVPGMAVSPHGLTGQGSAGRMPSQLVNVGSAQMRRASSA